MNVNETKWKKRKLKSNTNIVGSKRSIAAAAAAAANRHDTPQFGILPSNYTQHTLDTSLQFPDQKNKKKYSTRIEGFENSSTTTPVPTKTYAPTTTPPISTTTPSTVIIKPNGTPAAMPTIVKQPNVSNKLQNPTYNINLFQNNSSVNSVFSTVGSGYVPTGFIIDNSFENMPIYYWNHIYSSMTENEQKIIYTENLLNSYLLDSFKIDANGNIKATFNKNGKLSIIDTYTYAKTNLDSTWKSHDKDQRFIDTALLTDLTALYTDNNDFDKIGMNNVDEFKKDAWRRAYEVLVYKMTWLDPPNINVYDVSNTNIISYEHDPNMPYFYWNHIYDGMTFTQKKNIQNENYMNYYILWSILSVKNDANKDSSNAILNDFYMSNGVISLDSIKFIESNLNNIVKYAKNMDMDWISKDSDQAKINENIFNILNLYNDSKVPTLTPTPKSTPTPAPPDIVTIIKYIQTAYVYLTNKLVNKRVKLISSINNNVIGNVKKSSSSFLESFVDSNSTSTYNVATYTVNIDNTQSNRNSANGGVKMSMGSYNSGNFLINNPEVYSVNTTANDNVFDQVNNMDFGGMMGGDDNQANNTYGAVFEMMNYVINIILAIILYPFFYTQNFIQFITDTISDTFSTGSNATLNDKVCVYNAAVMIISYFLCIYIFFNWFYIIRYLDNGFSVKLWDISWSHLRRINGVLGFFLKYLVCQVSFVNKCVLMIQKLAAFWDSRLVMIIQFVITSIMILYLKFPEAILGMCTGSGNAGVGGLCIAYIFIFAIYTFVIQDKAEQFAQFSSITMVVLTIIIFILRVVFSIIFIYIAVFFIGVYLVLYSFFGILIYSPLSYSETIHKVYELMTYGLEPPKNFKYTECRRRTWWEWFIESIKGFMRNLINYFFYYGFLIIMIYITKMYYNVLDDMSLAGFLIIVNIIIIGIILYYAWFHREQINATTPLINKVEKAFGLSSLNETDNNDSNNFKKMFSGFLYKDFKKEELETTKNVKNIVNKFSDFIGMTNPSLGPPDSIPQNDSNKPIEPVIATAVPSSDTKPATVTAIPKIIPVEAIESYIKDPTVGKYIKKIITPKTVELFKNVENELVKNINNLKQ